MVVRTGYSFRRAFGHLTDVHKRVLECGYSAAPIADTCNTFGWTRWSKLCAKAEIKPIFGVEIAVVPDMADKKPPIDWWTFLAIDAIRPINELIQLATRASSKEPCLTYDNALAATGVIKIAGHAARLNLMPPAEDLFIGLSPACSKGYLREARAHGHPFVARSDNFYPTEDQKELYRVALGMRSNTQTFPQHILTDDEWREAMKWVTSDNEQQLALHHRNNIFSMCNARLVKAELIVPDKPKTLRQLCEEGATRVGIDLNDPVYSERLEKNCN